VDGNARWRAARFVLLSGTLILTAAIIASAMVLRGFQKQDDGRFERNQVALVTMFAAEVAADLATVNRETSALSNENVTRIEAAAGRYAQAFENQFLIVDRSGRKIAAASALGADAALPSLAAIAKYIPSGDATTAFRDRVAIEGRIYWLTMQRVATRSATSAGPLWAIAVTDESHQSAHQSHNQHIAWAIAAIFSLAMLGLMVWLSARFARSELAAEVARQALAMEMKYRDLIEAQQIVKSGSWITDGATDSFFPSLEYLNILKLTPETCPKTIREVIMQLVHPDQQEAALENIQKILSGQSYEGTRRVTLRDGTEKWLLFRAEPRRDALGKMIGHRGIVIDITSQQLAEQRLIEGEKRYRLITENVTDIVSQHDREGRVLYCSPSIKRVFGYDPTKSVGAMAIDLVHPDDRQQVLRTLGALIDGEAESATTVCRFRNASGEYRWLESVLVPVVDPQKGFMHYQMSSRDVTRRKEVELALRASEERFRSLTELSADWYWEQDRDYRFTFSSTAPPAATNAISQSLLGKSHWDAFPDALDYDAWVAHRADLDARRPFQNLIVEIRGARQGHISYYNLNGRPVYDEAGQFIGYRGTGRDITARHLTELSLARRTRELAKTNAALEEEVATRQRLERDFLLAIEMELAEIGLELHDDLGQDLTGIALLTSALSRKLRDQGHPGNAEAARISELVNRTIKHTRMISHGLSPYIWGSTGLVAALKQLASDIDSLGVARCETSLAPVEIVDEIVARSLYRIAQESVNNALKHSQANRIVIALDVDESGVQLTITDDGKGGIVGSSANVHENVLSLRDRKFHSIRHRASAIGAALDIHETENGGRGTVIRVHWRGASELISPLHQTIREPS
jgi:PAS domain S-box-containing protein